MSITTPERALAVAIEAGKNSPCAKSKRGVAIFHRERGLLATGFNHPPRGFACDGSDACRKQCRNFCVHAEADALSKVRSEELDGASLVHTKVEGNRPIPTGGPSCLQCAPILADSGIDIVWLYHAPPGGGLGFLKAYTSTDFHARTLLHHGIEPIFDGRNHR